MKKLFPILLMSLGLASGAFAQTASGGVTMSNDPTKAAAVEKHAQEIKAREAQQQQAHAAAKSSPSTATKTKSQPKKKTGSSTKSSATK
jgi:hypothetical protein